MWSHLLARTLEVSSIPGVLADTLLVLAPDTAWQLPPTAPWKRLLLAADDEQVLPRAQAQCQDRGGRDVPAGGVVGFMCQRESRMARTAAFPIAEACSFARDYLPVVGGQDARVLLDFRRVVVDESTLDLALQSLSSWEGQTWGVFCGDTGDHPQGAPPDWPRLRVPAGSLRRRCREAGVAIVAHVAVAPLFDQWLRILPELPSGVVSLVRKAARGLQMVVVRSEPAQLPPASSAAVLQLPGPVA